MTTTALSRSLLRASWHSWLSNDNRDCAGPWWLQWLWTLLFCAALAVPFTLLGFVVSTGGEGAWRNAAGWARWYGLNLIVSLVIGATIHLLFDAARALFATPERVRSWRGWQRSLFFAGVPVLGVLIGWPTGLVLAGVDLSAFFGTPEMANTVRSTLLASLLITIALHRFFAARARRAEAERSATEAQLRLLQAQIEPHFLFNTLANVAALIDHDTLKAKQLLLAFTDYLRSSLTALRSGNSSVADELALAENYLRLAGARMAERLVWTVDADSAARRVPLPPLLLQPLVENAVLHGLEPALAGGRIDVRARVEGGRLTLEVQDNGCGLAAAPGAGKRPGAGVALANIRQRLHARWGADATLAVQALELGTLARITLPAPVQVQQP